MRNTDYLLVKHTENSFEYKYHGENVSVMVWGVDYVKTFYEHCLIECYWKQFIVIKMLLRVTRKWFLPLTKTFTSNHDKLN